MTLQQNDVREPLARETPPPTATLVADPFADGGEMVAVMRSVDWASTPIGPVESWSESIRMMVRVLLVNRFPMLLWWGPEYVQLYNDAYRPVLGSKHPRSMGQRASECWPEIWDIIGPLIDTPFNGGPSTWMEDIDLEIERSGFREETHYTIAYSPVPDATAPRGIGGVLATVHEITEKVVAERRVVLLRDLGVRSVTGAQTAEAACEVAARILSKHARDVPFALLYLIDQDRQVARLAGAAGVEPGLAISPRVVPLGEAAADDAMAPLRRAVISERLQIVEPLASRFGPVPAGPWAAEPEKAVVLPLLSSSAHGAAGVLVAGVSARLQFDDAYRAFFDVLTTQIASAVANARAYEEEAQRAEELAELDRAKTAFFSNVSHEFRTPLTLILGPAEDALADQHLDPESRQRGEIIHRNALRLLKLVNTLLDFSRIEAGRIDASYVRTDLAALTTQLASTFRSAIERAGLRLTIDAPPLDDAAAPIYVDRDMWEKIVLNLVSNAFKHTFEGEIAVAVRLAPDARHVELAVRDTGIGIPADQVPHLFERFHRVPNARSRTHEGTGIGLALVQELVKLHDGTIAVTTVDGEGSTFTVSIPVGAHHLPPDRVRETEDPHRASLGGLRSSAGAAYSTEALRWLPDENDVGAAGQSAVARDPTAGARILLADDNADLREYAARLLRQRGWLVETVADGAAALEAVLDHRPDLVLSDVMMPRLDGFELVRAMRADSSTATIPVILLSARAGEEAKVEGLDFGADDYLIKPFSARELLARVGSHLTLAHARARVEAEADAAREDLARANQRERAARAEAEEARVAAQMANRSKSAFLAAMSHELRTPLNAIAGHAQLLEMGVHGVLTEAQREALARIQRSEQHLLALINDVLNFAKLEAGRVQYTVEDVRLTDVVSEVVAMVDPQLRAKAITVDASIPRDLVAHADREKVGQVLLNLLSNAVKFTNAGGHVAIDAPERRAARADDAASDRDPQPMVFLRVTDTGTGVPREKQAVIFQPFVQLERNLKRPAEGTGLGLSISRDLAHGMGGDLRVRSVEGHGARFTLALPRASDPAGRGLTGGGRD
ncbi:MAG TPA: ATP-binding protein [Gemmatimonadales bacterium]|nr:ATP-binding protein [Gemmatimonadales bacterium]